MMSQLRLSRAWIPVVAKDLWFGLYELMPLPHLRAEPLHFRVFTLIAITIPCRGYCQSSLHEEIGASNLPGVSKLSSIEKSFLLYL